MRPEDRPAKRRKSCDTQAANDAARKKERRGERLAIDWMMEQVHAGELADRLARTWRGEEGYGLDKLLRDPELDGHLSQHQVELMHRKTATLARFYHARSTAPHYLPRSTIARQVEEEMSFGTLKLIPWRTILLWEQEFRDEKYKLVPSVKGRWSRWWILTEPDVRARCFEFLKERTDCQGRVNLRVKDFRAWLNGEWPNDPGPFSLHDVEDEKVKARLMARYPQLPLSWSCARSWLIKLGYKYCSITGKGYFDGHNRPDVLQWRKEFLGRMAWRLHHMPVYMHLTPQEASQKGVPLEDIASFTRTGIGGPGPSGRLVEHFKDGYDWLWDQCDCEKRRYSDKEKEVIIMVQRRVRALQAAKRGVEPVMYGIPPSWDSKDGLIIPTWQDEVIYKCYDGQRRAWKKGKAVERIQRKGQGRGIMLSGFISDPFGFLHLTREDVIAVNIQRLRHGKEPLRRFHVMGNGNAYGFCFFKYGKNAEGYWDSDAMIQHVDEYMECFEHKYGDQAKCLFLFDWSSGHAKFPAAAWRPAEMNLRYGGTGASAVKVGKMAPTIVVERAEVMGNEEPGMRTIGPERPLQTGDIQHLFFREGEFPWYERPPRGVAGAEWAAKFLGQAKGLKQLLWERGLWREGMTVDGQRTVRGVKQKAVPSLSARIVMGACPDIIKQKSALQVFIEERGHMCDFLPKFHCELNPIELVSRQCTGPQVPPRVVI